MKFKRIISTILAGLMLATSIPATPAKAEEASEEDLYKAQVVQNWYDYRDESNGFWFVWSDYNYAYIKLQNIMENQTDYHKFITDIGFTLEDCNITVDDCITYLSTVLTITEQGLNQNLSSMGEYDATKGVLDYTLDTVSNVADYVGLKEVEGDLKLIQDEIGLALDLTGILTENIDEIKGADMIVRNYDNQNRILEAVYANSKIPEMKEAAGILMEINGYTTLYYLDQFTKYGEAVGKFGIDTFNLAFDEDFKGWLELAGLTKASGLVEKFEKIWNPFSAYVGTALLVADIAVGNELRYMNEVTALNDITYSILIAMSGFDPDYEQDPEKLYDDLVEYVPYLQTLCVTRLRGEYVTTRIAAAHGSLLGLLTNSEKADEYFDRANAALSAEYKRISEIFMADEFVITINWNRTKEEIKKGSKVITEITADEPNFTCPALDDIVEASIQKSLLEKVESWREEVRTEFKDATLDGDYANSGSLRLSEVGRMDSKIMTWLYDNSLYYSGAMHPIHYTKVYAFDAVDGVEVTLADILEEDGYEKIGDLIDAHKDQVGVVEQIDPKSAWNSGSAKKPGTSWMLTSLGFLVIFAPGSIASYASGSIRITVPYSELDGILKEKYIIPDKRSDKGEELIYSAGNPVSDPSVRVVKTSTPDGGTEHLTITAEEPIYDVMVGHVSYYNASYGTASMDVPMVSMNMVTNHQLIDITTSKYTTNPDIYVSFTDGKGVHKTQIVGIGEDGKVEVIEIGK